MRVTTRENIRWDRVAKARARIASGKYDSPTVIRTILGRRGLDRLLNALDKCLVGNGHEYRDVVANILTDSLDGVVDAALSRKEFSAGGGRADIDLPMRLEALHAFPLWDHWTRRYEIRSIIVETKNEVKQATAEDIGQLERYLNRANLGRFGIFVARSGFAQSATTELSAIARKGERLILPLSHSDLHGFAQAANDDNAMEYLRRRETLLLQA